MKRITTITVNEAVDNALRKKQASIILKTNGSCSYSQLINEILAKSLRIKLD